MINNLSKIITDVITTFWIVIPSFISLFSIFHYLKNIKSKPLQANKLNFILSSGIITLIIILSFSNQPTLNARVISSFQNENGTINLLIFVLLFLLVINILRVPTMKLYQHLLNMKKKEKQRTKTKGK